VKPSLNSLLLLAAATLMQCASALGQSGASSIFKAVPSPNPNFNNGLQAVSASSPSDIWAVGESAIHYDGTNWTAFSIPVPKGDSLTNLAGVVDVSPTEAWAAGNVADSEGIPGQVIEEWNGTSWSVSPGPKFAAGDQPNLKAMTSTSSTDIWAIGDLLDNDAGLLFFLFEHYDGTSWKASKLLSGDQFLFGASADAIDDVWAVGFNGPENDDSQTLALHFDGTSWKVAKTPSVGSGANQFNGVLALAPNDVWAVGFSTPVPPPAEAATLTLIEHFDGTSWKVVPSPNIGPKSVYQSNRLFGLTASSPTDIWAFGSYFAADGSGHQRTLLLHWNGTKWTIAPSPDPTNGVFLSDLLIAGVTPTPGNIWIVGDKDIPPHDDTLVIHTLEGGSMGGGSEDSF
jgi:hypothetical protein